MKKIIIFIISIIFIFKSFIINAQENKNNSEKTDQAIADLGLYFPGWYVKKPDEKISKVYLALFNKDLVKKKYDTPNPVITCLDKNSDLYKKGAKLYDEILEINEKHPSLYKNSSEPFSVKLKRENQILTFQKLNPVMFGKEDALCVPEYADSICLKEFVTNTNNPDLWFRVFECCEKNNVLIFPFLEQNEGTFLRLDSLKWVIYDLEKKQKYVELKRYIKIAERHFKSVEAVLKEFPDYKITESYSQLSSIISKLNLYNKDFKDDAKIEYNLNENIGRIKNSIDIQIKQDPKNLVALNFVRSNMYYLKQEKQFEYLEKILTKLISDNYFETSDEYVLIIGEFYEYLGWIYAEQFNSKKFQKTIDEAQNWIKLKTPLTAQTRVSKKRILHLNATFALSLNLDSINIFIKKDLKNIENYLNEFELLSVEEQNQIISKDKTYLYDGYTDIANMDNIFNFTGKGISYFHFKALEEIKLRPQIGNHYKIYNYSNMLLGADKFNDDVLVNKTLLDIKNFFIEAKGKDQHLIAIKNSISVLSGFYIQRGFFAELNELMNFYDKLFVVKYTENLSQLELGAIYYYYYAKSYIERNNNNYKKSLDYLEKIVNIPYFKIDTIIYDYNYHKGKIDNLRLLVLQNILPDIFDAYYQTNQIQKIKEITKLGLNVEIDNLSYQNLEPILLVSNPMRIFNPLIFYYSQSKDKEKLEMVAKFITNNLEKIGQESTFGTSLKTPGDFTYSATELIKNNEKKLANNLYEKANYLVSKKYNDVLFNSIWRYSNTDINAATQILEGANLLESDDFFDKAFNTAQIIKNANTSKDILKGYLSKKNQSNPDISEYHNLQKELISLTKLEESTLTRTSNKILQDKFNRDFEIKKNLLDEFEQKIKKSNPEYFQSIKFEGVKLKNIQNKLQTNQAIVDYYFSEDKLAVIIIKKNSYNIHIQRIVAKDLKLLKNSIRNTLQISKAGKLIPFDLKNSYEFNKIVFLNLKKYLTNINYLFIVPNGVLNEIPLHALPETDGTNCLDCSSVQWNFSNFTFNYLTSLDKFQDNNSEDFLTVFLNDNFKKIFNEFKNVRNNSQKKESINNFVYLGIGDPDLYEKKSKKDRSVENLNLERFMVLRSFNLSGNTRSINIEDFYSPLKGSRDEILFAAKTFGQENSMVLVREDATETKIKETDLSRFNIIHFATHAEVSGAMRGLNEPFLVLSPPKVKTDKDNGLLMMNEIMQLNLNADLVILSACNTGSVEDQYSGSYSGLAKAFFVAGAKSVLVSNWFVEDTATQRLIKKFVENITQNKGNFAENLNLTMKELSKQNNQYSHPIFWAPFVFVGTDKEINKNVN
jgi:CHAT domain-containing protein